MASLQPIKAHQVSLLGETPAQARARMQRAPDDDEVRPGLGKEVEGPLTPEHLAAIRAAEEGFSGAGQDGSVEDAPELTEPPTPSKAMEMIQQLSQDKLQLQTELNAAFQLIEHYRAQYGDLD